MVVSRSESVGEGGTSDGPCEDVAPISDAFCEAKVSHIRRMRVEYRPCRGSERCLEIDAARWTRVEGRDAAGGSAAETEALAEHRTEQSGHLHEGKLMGMAHLVVLRGRLSC
jgi:hypothetical protein